MRAELNSTRSMEESFCINVHRMRLFWSAERTKSYARPIHRNYSRPTLLVLAHTNKPAAVYRPSLPLILVVPGVRNIAKIFNLVVTGIPVYMINKLFRPFTIAVHPSKPMRKMEGSINSDKDVAITPFAASDITSFFIRDSHLPRKDSSFWVVVKQFAQTLCGKIGLSHDTVPSLIGQRPARVISTGGLRHFITHACSGAAEITKCLHQAARAAVSVCMPANHRRFSNPLGL